MVIILTGVPKAGKSLLSGALYYTMQELGFDFFLERLCPDQEGIWTWDSGNLEMARRLKNELKERGLFFTPAFVEFKRQSVKGLLRNFDYVILDVGGIPSKENKRMIEDLSKEDHIVFVLKPAGAKKRDVRNWVSFLKRLGFKRIVVFETKWDFKKDLKEQAMETANRMMKYITGGNYG